MKKIKFWLEIDEAKGEYRQVELTSDADTNLSIHFLDNENLGKKTKDILLSKVSTIFTPKYIKLLGYESLGNKTFALKGYYLYTLKPYVKKPV